VRTILHLSDLHFGALDEQLLPPLLETSDRLRPDLIAISGDFTQRARRSQFRRARAFLDQLRAPILAVPGNHDVPLLDLAVRFLDPLANYRRFISGDLAPVFADLEIVVVGLNSARSTLFAHGQGRLNASQVRGATARFDAAPPGAVKIVVTHHPFEVPRGHGDHHVIGRAEMAMSALAGAGADLFLSGHLHVSHVGHSAERYKIAAHSALVVQAGTISRRGRGEVNSFNLLRIEPSSIAIERFSWNETTQGFTPAWEGLFERAADGWHESGVQGTRWFRTT
jgi:3',5'-cyclic AMP phosphodiesterase CpdA